MKLAQSGLVLLAAAGLCSGVGAGAGTGGTTPPSGIRSKPATVRAFTNARILVSPARTVERGTLVVREGRVLAVGRRATVPEDAVVHDLDGKTVYPGFIDPFTEYGLGNVGPLNAEPEKPGPQYEATRVGAGAWNDAIHADRNWVDSFEPDPEAARTLLDRGVTVVQSAKLDGIFRGRAFVTTLAAGLPNDVVLEPQALHFAAFDKGSSRQSYPSSLMGSIALVRQTLLDADWYAEAHAAWGRDPTQPRPELNRDVAALAAYDGPFVFQTADEQSLLRAGRLSAETGQPFVHVGSNLEYNRIAEIAALGRPIILPVAFPATPDVGSYESELDVSLADLRHWERAPHNPAVLESHGVRFAFTGHGLNEKKENFLENVRRAVRSGLSRETALAALTTVPAELCRVEDQAGTLGPGKLANFLIADGDLLTEKARILSVWIQGERARELHPLDATDFRGEYRLDIDGAVYELTIAGRPDEPRGHLARGGRETLLEDLQAARRELRFRADLDVLEEQGVARFTLTDLGHRLSGRVAWPDGRLLTVGVERTGDAADDDEDAPDTSDGDDDGTLASRFTYPNVAFGSPSPAVREDVLVRGATLWTGEADGVLESADLLVIDGKIEAVGRDLPGRRGVREIEAGGKHVTAGIIDEHSHLAISGGVNEGSHAVTAEVRIGDVLDADDIAIYRALAGGVTTAQLLHGSANPIGGQAQVVKLRWGEPVEGLATAAPPTIKFALGENVKQSNYGDLMKVRYPQSRLGVETIIKDAFIAAREYQREWREYGALGERERERRVPPRRDVQLDTLVQILDGERFIHCHSYTQAEILMLMRLAEELGFRVQTFTHVLEGYKVAPEMAEHGASASSFADWWAYKFEVYDAIPYNTCLLHDNGIVTSVNSDSPEVIRHLNHDAAKSVMYCGMDESEALKLVTLNPAIQLRIDERVGSLAEGKDADFVIWSGHPLSVYSRVEETWIEGARYFSLKRDAELREADRSERRGLVQKALRASEPGGGPSRDAVKKEKVWHCEDVEDIWHAGD